MFTIHPLIQQLTKLRESSKEAVADANISQEDDLKNFLHIERQLERNLKEIIIRSSTQQGPTLVMVCGNVGDGKSHLISKIKQDPDMAAVLEGFSIHNDATESFSPNQTCVDTLSEILSPFTDVQLPLSDQKWILAINLGTLSNFLEEKGAAFTQLDTFVNQKGIINPEEFSIADSYDPESCFQFVNFTNHHFYSLDDQGVNASLFEDLFSRVVSPVPQNPLYLAYQELCAQEWSSECPVRANFEALSIKGNQQVIARLLVECILKEKRIISFRQILNFLYDILVPYELANADQATYRMLLSALGQQQRLSLYLTNYIFEQPHISKIFESFYNLDPAVRRYEELDGRAIRIFTSVNKMEVLAEDFPELCGYPRQLMADIEAGDALLHKTYLRLYYFYHYNGPLYKDDYFDSFAKSLYYANIKHTKGLKDINELVKSAVLLWNGSIKDDNKMMYNSISKHAAYRLFRGIQLKAILPPIGKKIEQATLHQFGTEVTVSLQSESPSGGMNEPVSIDVDYSLYVLFQMIKKGYRPNRLDRNSFVNFVTMVDSLTYSHSDRAKIYIDEINIGDPIDFTLAINDYGEFTFEKYNP